MFTTPSHPKQTMSSERILSKITAVDPPKKNGTAAATSTATDTPRLSTSPFTIDHEAEARAALIASLQQDALIEDKGAAVAAIEGDHQRKDRHTDKARCLRATAEHLAKAVMLLLAFCLTSCEGYPMSFAVSGDVKAEGMKEPVRLEWRWGTVTMSGKKVVRNVQP